MDNKYIDRYIVYYNYKHKQQYQCEQNKLFHKLKDLCSNTDNYILDNIHGNNKYFFQYNYIDDKFLSDMLDIPQNYSVNILQQYNFYKLYNTRNHGPKPMNNMLEIYSL